jgi:Cdc6-like AAA superfamily ATPase
MVKDEKLAAAVSRILQRSEKSDQDRLLETFVDVGILPQLHNNNSQIVYGRRGTGKTHVFSVLQSRLSEDSRNTVVYIDARTLGSSAQFSDT